MFEFVAESIADINEPGNSIMVDYNKHTGEYRISVFEDYHWKDELIFKGVKEENDEKTYKSN